MSDRRPGRAPRLPRRRHHRRAKTSENSTESNRPGHKPRPGRRLATAPRPSLGDFATTPAMPIESMFIIRLSGTRRPRRRPANQSGGAGSPPRGRPPEGPRHRGPMHGGCVLDRHRAGPLPPGPRLSADQERHAATARSLVRWRWYPRATSAVRDPQTRKRFALTARRSGRWRREPQRDAADVRAAPPQCLAIRRPGRAPRTHRSVCKSGGGAAPDLKAAPPPCLCDQQTVTRLAPTARLP
jgi:hypothetical protein